MSSDPYPRDLIGYGGKPPKAKWPGSARVALQFVLNYEEGGENSILHGDPASEAFLSEIVGARPLEGVRHMSMESIYEYGSRVGVWRVLELFSRYELPLTVFGVAMAMERNPAAVDALLKAGHEIASHGWRWINYQDVPESRRARAHAARDRDPPQAHRRAAARLVHRAHQPEHAPARGRGRRLRLRRRRLQRRPALVRHALPGQERQAAARRALHAGRQRHALRHRRRDSTPATSSSPTSRTPSTCSTRKATACRA